MRFPVSVSKKFFAIWFLFCAYNAYSENIYAIFNAQAIKDSNLSLGNSGIVTQIFVDVGSVVKKDDTLLELFHQDQLAQIESIRQQYVFNKKQYERYKKSGGAVDKNTLEKYYADYKRSESDLAYQEALLSKSILKAPFDGVIAYKYVELGDGVTANNTELFRLISNKVKIVLEFDFKYINQVKVGDTFEFSIDGANSKQIATIDKIYPTASESNRKVKAEAFVEDIIPGTFGDGYIKTQQE
ncbi:MAG: HlyD family efflux transporter periplasmic adaptor subunit [Helicobacter sp.]|uniref:efflux RND transporter periplasmic adaptor subunit n=1 Tax=Helicobacter sp. 10-6591 TaxID=2004998 RepID=UPI000DCC8FE4|nr:HlyD family efflux transporter periplasmic adaptor subunit [Helicobacter sp. 10-6591]MCI6216996.1 HlyD family efflux transporter periplasmic adaptor subunit [Helicobacter sp.]MCI7485756.1 HlyD family efflux transporter periplasmic adaptor subunit [Helicobacter sp.]MDD7567896.1 HlyD family efflux transporter periplasmic adaptor subunit [Helicobacter sp.]MDY5740005.1 HlyD family efflux transporter periplasmic adaptor subunit [Helicobacter sp.]RAX55993.1 efflux transporter periplasmic adaptor 